MTIDLREQYQRLARRYDESRGVFDMSTVINGFSRRLPPSGALLDLGCGAGEPFARWFTDRGWSVTGVDYTPAMVELARRYVPEMKVLNADMREVAWAPASFDAITCIYSLFHLPSDDQFELLARMHDWLRPGGHALFTYATREYTGAETFSGYKTFLGEELFYSHHTPQTLTEHLGGVGFSVEAADYREIGGETFLWVTVAKQ